MVAEYLWYALTVDGGVADSVFKVHPPGFLATSPGGDGLVIHRDAVGPTYSFRLWELKKCTGRKTVGGTVSVAFTQLEAKGARYLAQFTSIGQETDDPELAELYGHLVEDWLAGSPRAAAGVAVHTSTPKVPRRCFTRFGQRFARFTDPSQLRGLITAVDDFTAFAQRVRAVIWTGL
jgi:hypothetical protein